MKKLCYVFTFLLIVGLSFQRPCIGQIAGEQVAFKTPITQTTPNALLYLPWDYDISNKKYPLIIFGHGIDETTVARLAGQGLPGIISNNNPPYAIENGDTVRFIVLSITGQSFIGEQTMSDGAKDLIKRGFRIDTNRIYVTGLSAGARSTVGYISHQVANDYQFVSAAVPMSYTLKISEMDGGYWVGNFKAFAGKGLWAFTGESDVHTDVAIALVDSVNMHSPGNGRLTIYPGGHCCWMTYYAPTYREPVNGKMMNIYEWMLQYSLDGAPVPPVNLSPTAEAGDDQTTTLPDNQVSLDGSASFDPDGNISSFQWSQQSGPTTATFSDAGAAKTDATGLEAGIYVFTLTIKDNDGATANDNIIITVNKAPQEPPVADAGTDQTIALPLDSINLNGLASSDQDGQIIHYKWVKSSGPASYTIDNDTIATPIVSNLQVGTYVFTLTVTDDSAATASSDVTITVNDSLVTSKPNEPPVANAGSDQAITLPLDSVTLDGSASSDSDGTIASYKWVRTSGSGTYTIDNDTIATPTVSNLQVGTYVFTLTVTDDSAATASSDVTITVNDSLVTSKPNEPPVANAGSDQAITLPLDSVTLDGSASSDSDGTIASYKWVRTNGPDSYTITNDTIATPTVGGLQIGTYVFTLTVTDDSAATASSDVTITVNDSVVTSKPNEPPIANAGSDQTVTIPLDSVTLDGSASSDSDGTIASYKWVKTSGPNSYTIANDTVATPAVGDLQVGTYVFTLTVTDDSAATASSDVKITVNDSVVTSKPNEPPVANAGNDQTITLPNNSVVLDGSASSDPDGHIVSYKWVKKSGPDAYILENNANATSVVDSLQVGTYVFTLTVTDDSASSISADVTITVKAKYNGLPVANAGNDTTIYYPVNTVYLDGSRSYTNGGILYSWKLVSGPSSYQIMNPTRAITEVRGMVSGAYVFQLTVTDYGRHAATDQVIVTILPDQTQPGDVPFTANTSVTPYAGLFQYGTNPSSYGNGWGDTAIASIANQAGVHSLRLPLPGYFVDHYGYDIRLNEFDYYTHQLGMKEITLFVGQPGDDHVDKTVYPPASKHSDVYANLYTPIWDNGENGTPVNENNYFAVYIYNLVKRYGKNVKFWEIVNEPDMTGFWDNANKLRKGNWYDSPPSPEALFNLEAPIYYYIRMLRVAYEVIKKIDPEDYIAPGGLGYPAFLDALLRYTDNPDGGKVTPDYPLMGGAYFDVLSFHSYPAYNLQLWDNAIGGFRWYRYSDKAANAVIDLKNTFDSLLVLHGYNGIKYPKKPFILTEVNLPRKSFDTYFGSEEAQRNFIIKALVKAQQNGIVQLYTFMIGETADYSTATGPYDLMGLYENLKRDEPGQQKLTGEGKAYKTTSMLLYGWRYDSVRTHALNLPSEVDGAAFKQGDKFRYVLWAKTSIDKSEVANADYSFPASFNLDSVYRYEWNYSVDPAAQSKSGIVDIALTGAPSFFTEAEVVDSINRPPTADAGDNKTIMLPVNSVTLDGSGSTDIDGSIASFQWTKTAGPSTFKIDSTDPMHPTITGLESGVYTFTITVTDNLGATSSDNVIVTVNRAANQYPVANAGLGQTITLPTNSVHLDGSASLDPDGSIKSYQWKEKSGPTTYDFSNVGTAQTDVTNLTGGTYVFTLTVTDDRGASTSSDVTILVNTLPNIPPIADAGKNITITLPTDSTILNGSASSDPDGKIAQYVWSQQSGPSDAVFDQGDGGKIGVFALEEGTYSFTLTVTDDKGVTGSDQVAVVVNPAPNEPPIADAGSDHTIILPVNSVSLSGAASNDPDGKIVSYKWTKTAGPPSFKIVSANTVTTQVESLVAGSYSFTLTIKDNKGATAQAGVIITVQPAPNQVPTAQVGADQVIQLPTSSVNLDGSGSSDPDGSIATYHWIKTSGPAGFTFANDSSAKTSVSGLTAGKYVFTLVVSDNDGARDSGDVTITVNSAPDNGSTPPVNQAPVAQAGADQVIQLPTSSVNLDGSGSSDPDGSIATYHWIRTSGPTGSTFSDDSSAKTSVSGLMAGEYVFALIVTDNSGAVDSGDVTITVNSAPDNGSTPPANQAPVAQAGADQVIQLPTSSVNLDGSGSSDPDGSIATYHWIKTSGPAGFTFADDNSAKTSVSGLTVGKYVFTLVVTDNDGAKDSGDVTITVNSAPDNGGTPPANEAPVAQAGADQVIQLPTSSVNLDGSGSSDPDGSIATYHWIRTSGPTGFTFSDDSSAKTSVSGLMAGEYVFALIVTDNRGAVDSGDVTITVNSAPDNGSTPPANQAPIAQAGGDQVIQLPTSSVNLDGSGSSDPDGSIATYHWIKTSGPAGFTFANDSSAKTSVSGLTAGKYVFTLVVTDIDGARDSGDVTLTVNSAPDNGGTPPANQAPVAQAGADQVIQLPTSSVTLDGSGSSDPDGSIATYHWVETSGPTGFTFENDGSAKTGVSGLVAGKYVFTLVVTDNDGAKDSGDVTITVNKAPDNGGNPPANQAPIAQAGADQVIQLPTSLVNLDGSGSSDPDGTIATYHWIKTSGPTGFSFADDSSAKTAVSGLVAGKYAFTLVVTDNDGTSDSGDVTITVNKATGSGGNPPVNQAPIAQAGADQVIQLPTSSVSLDGSGSSDPDGNISSYRWVKKSGPQRLELSDAESAAANANGLEQGTYVFTLTVTDDQGASSSADVSITVEKAPNKPPVASAGNSKNIFLPDNSIILDGLASSDSDGQVVSYKWEQKSGPTSATISGANTGKTEASGLVNGVYVFTLVVADNDGATDTAEVTIGVYQIPNQVPIANAGKDSVILQPESSITLDGSASYDPDGEITSYHWEPLTGPSLALMNQLDQARCLVTGLVQNGTYDFKLTVTDNKGATSSATVTVYVLPAKDTIKTSFKIYPNPVHGELHVELNKALTGLLQFRIIDVNGRIVRKYNFGMLPMHITKVLDVSGLADGAYFVQLIEDNQLRDVQKMIKY